MKPSWDCLESICGTIKGITGQKKYLYVYLSLLASVLLSFIILNDVLQYTVFERPDRTTQHFTESLLITHTMTYYAAILGFVYNTKAGKKIGRARLEWFAIVLTFLVSLTRVTIDIGFLTFRKEQYKNFND